MHSLKIKNLKLKHLIDDIQHSIFKKFNMHANNKKKI